ncbi:MAG: hypothetical protein ACMUEM_07365 [Flavobacteriales bacterium AspAUS03]
MHIVPLVGSEVDIEHYIRAFFLSDLFSDKPCTALGLFFDGHSGNLKYAILLKKNLEDVLNVDLAIESIIPVEDPEEICLA